MCKYYDAVKAEFEKHGMSHDDIDTYIAPKSSRPAFKIRWAIANKAQWQAELERIHMGKGSGS